MALPTRQRPTLDDERRSGNLLSAVLLATGTRGPMAVHAGLRHGVEYVLDACALPRLRPSLAIHRVPRVPRDVAPRGLVSLSRRRAGRGRARGDRRDFGCVTRAAAR